MEVLAPKKEKGPLASAISKMVVKKTQEMQGSGTKRKAQDESASKSTKRQCLNTNISGCTSNKGKGSKFGVSKDKGSKFEVSKGQGSKLRASKD
jgi:hypothetical protein